MFKITGFLIFVSVCIAISGCDKDTESTEMMAGYPLLTEEVITPELLYQTITLDDPYTEWESWPGYEGEHDGFSRHGDYHQVFINSVVSESLPLTDKQIPAGGIVVKENYTYNDGLVALTVMVKLDGYHPSAGDWYWGKFTLMDGEQVCGKIDECINCHVSVKRNDYLFTHTLDKE